MLSFPKKTAIVGLVVVALSWMWVVAPPPVGLSATPAGDSKGTPAREGCDNADHMRPCNSTPFNTKEDLAPLSAKSSPEGSNINNSLLSEVRIKKLPNVEQEDFWEPRIDEPEGDDEPVSKGTDKPVLSQYPFLNPRPKKEIVTSPTMTEAEKAKREEHIYQWKVFAGISSSMLCLSTVIIVFVCVQLCRSGYFPCNRRAPGPVEMVNMDGVGVAASDDAGPATGNMEDSAALDDGPAVNMEDFAASDDARPATVNMDGAAAS